MGASVSEVRESHLTLVGNERVHISFQQISMCCGAWLGFLSSIPTSFYTWWSSSPRSSLVSVWSDLSCLCLCGSLLCFLGWPAIFFSLKSPSQVFPSPIFPSFSPSSLSTYADDYLSAPGLFYTPSLFFFLSGRAWKPAKGFAERESLTQLQFALDTCLCGAWKAEEEALLLGEADSQKAAANAYAVDGGGLLRPCFFLK